ncbi:MAG TPA: endonuclease/exonuclease/phosphatase family protein [Chthonomonadales bacterium]|nr:endonuclease/exonuclease/phosphatase family protein [Chthonomonadales bacterium]
MGTAAVRDLRHARRRRFASGLCAFYLLAVGTLWAVQATVAEVAWPVTLLLYVPQAAYLLPALLLLPLCAWARSGRGAIACIGACAIVAWPMMGFRWGSPGPPGEGVLRVMTYNLHGGVGGVARLTETIRAQNPHVLCLQEAVGPEGREGPAVLLPRDLAGYRFVRRGSVMIGSRVPMGNARAWKLDPPGVARDALAVDVNLGGRRATVVSVHFVTALGGGSIAQNAAGIARYARGMAEVRVRQADSLLERLNKPGPPVVVCGDFNTPPRGKAYERLSGLMRDAFAERGRGWGLTYRRDLPLWRIDYVWCGRGAEPVSAWAVRAPGSDHLPVVAEVSIPKPAARSSGDGGGARGVSQLARR